MAERHTLMVICTTTGNLRDRFVKRPRQTSMYYHYGPWRCHDSAPRMGPNFGLANVPPPKKSCFAFTGPCRVPFW